MIDTIARMRQQEAKASAPKSSYVPTFFKLGDKQRALIRPLVNLDVADVANFHRFFDPQTKRYVEAMCGKEQGLPCLYCGLAANAEEKKKKNELTAKETFFLPVWVYAILVKKVDPDTGMEVLDDHDNPVWEKLTYTDSETNQEKPVSGIRIMQLTFFGSIKSVADAFLKMYSSGKNITAQDFVIERVGADQHTKYIPSNKQPSEFKVKMDPITQEDIRERVLDASPIQSTGNSTTNTATSEVQDDDIPVF